MKTTFFSLLETVENLNCSIAITKHTETNNFTVSFLNQNTDPKIYIPPFVLTGSAEELDKHFIEAIQKPIQLASSINEASQKYAEKLKQVEAEAEHIKNLEILIKKQEKNIKALLTTNENIEQNGTKIKLFQKLIETLGLFTEQLLPNLQIKPN